MGRGVICLILCIALFSLSACGSASLPSQESVSPVVEPVPEVQVPQPEVPPSEVSQTQRRMKITAGDTVLYAELYDNETTLSFMELLPLTLDAFDRIGLVKSNVLPQRISDAGERTRQYEKGAVFYWHEGPEVAFCYSDHLPETVVDIIHIGKVESGIELFETYTGELLLELAEELDSSADVTNGV